MDDEIRPKALMIPFDKFVILDILTPEQYKNVISQMRRYVELGVEFEGLSPIEQMAFESLRPFMDENIKTYQRSVMAHREAGRRGGRPKRAEESEGNQEKPNGFSENQMGTNSAPKYKVQSSKDTDSKESIDIGASAPTSATKSKRFQPPEPDEVKAYMAEKGGTDAQAEQFWNFYESNGWKVGKNSMKSWKAAASGWLARDKEQFKTTGAPRNKAFMATRPPEEAEKAGDFLKNAAHRRSLKKKGDAQSA